jgi:1,4-dihydroxy-2-naphthoate octaprenyltransferase
MGLSFSFFYTATPVGLKYMAMGDITIFLCFGPLLSQATSLILTGNTTESLYFYCFPAALLTEGILHANNTRDIKEDQTAGIITLANLVGFNLSSKFYILLIIGAYLSTLYLALWYRYGVMLSFLTIPLSIALANTVKSKQLINLPEDTAKMHLLFGAFMVIGILITSKGFVETFFI